MSVQTQIDLATQYLLQESDVHREQMLRVELNKFSHLILSKSKTELEDIRFCIVVFIQKNYQDHQLVKAGRQMITLVEKQLKKVNSE